MFHFQKQDLSTEILQERRAELLNKHQQELSALDRRQASEKGDVESGALADCELKFAKAKLALKEKHYKVRLRFYVLNQISTDLLIEYRFYRILQQNQQQHEKSNLFFGIYQQKK